MSCLDIVMLLKIVDVTNKNVCGLAYIQEIVDQSELTYFTMVLLLLIVILALVAVGFMIGYYFGSQRYQSFSEAEATYVSQHTDGINILRTNTGRLYLSTNKQHVVDAFIKYSDPKETTGLWLKTLPCNQWSKQLIEFYKKCSEKPTIHVGRIGKKENDNNRKQLIELINVGFKIQTWKGITNVQNKNKNLLKSHLLEITCVVVMIAAILPICSVYYKF